MQRPSFRPSSRSPSPVARRAAQSQPPAASYSPPPPSQQQAWEPAQQAQHTQQAAAPAGRQRTWQDPEFAAQTLAAFPEKSVASVEEARCLIEKGGYIFLDVRPPIELEEEGRFAGATNIPLVHAERVFDAASGKRELEEWTNEDFVDQVKWRFPDLNTPLLVGDADGARLAVEALELLDDAGYTCLVGLKGGFAAWTRVFDSKGARRGASETVTA
ncbi:hypothetical protein COHA_001742 [Chlorella ohadii]|uniref:Rhodanese domain-containing protein n=1 Tax=Chlorella ohadii TaxID=2649997 RepID=A0AAD5H826_9CHLO|nr:hypothetical protein COHA_001742 [Chlorella ohadii]